MSNTDKTTDTPVPSPAMMPRRVTSSTTSNASTRNTIAPGARGFVGLSPAQIALREAADRELKGRANSRDVELLHRSDNLFAWYEILGVIAEQAESHLELRRSNLEERELELRVEGIDPSTDVEFLKHRMDIEAANRRGLFFLTHVRTKRTTVGLLMWREGITRRRCADVVQALVAIQQELDTTGDTTKVGALLDELIDGLYTDMTVEPEMATTSGVTSDGVAGGA